MSTIAVRLTRKDLGYKSWKTLLQCINMDKSKEYYYQSPLLFKDIPDFTDAEMLTECWKYFKSVHTNLTKEKLKPDTIKRIEQGPSDPIVNFYMTHIEPLFKMFIGCVQTIQKDIQIDTSMIIRFTFNRVNSDELVVCVIPGGKWWVLNLPTDKEKMGDWFTDLMKQNHYGKCMMVSLYKVKHPEGLVKLSDEK